MVPELARLLESTKSLERGQIADLAYELLRVLDGDAPEIDQARIDVAWSTDFRRRIEDIEGGNVQPLSHVETVSLARAMLLTRQK